MKNTALVTGASSGIGKAIAQIHAIKDGDLILVARRTEKLLAIKKGIEDTQNSKVKVITKDLTQPGACQEVYDELKREGINIEYLVNNAGFGGQGKFHEREWGADQSMIQLNVLALSELCRLFLPDFVSRNSGRILNVSSTASLMAGPLQAVYFATKAYVTSFSNALMGELHDTNVTVTTLLPGATKTEFAEISGLDKTALFEGKVFSATQVAKAGYEGMMAGKLDVWAGLTTAQKIMLKALPFTPKKIALEQIRQMQEIK